MYILPGRVLGVRNGFYRKMNEYIKRVLDRSKSGNTQLKNQRFVNPRISRLKVTDIYGKALQFTS
jgi:hypothetical protein